MGAVQQLNPDVGIAAERDPRAAFRGVAQADLAAIDRVSWHAELQRRHWAGFSGVRRWSCPPLPPNAAALTLVLAFVAWAVQRSLVPDFAPGPRAIPQEVRDRAALLFVLCWIPAIRYLRAGAELRRPVPFFSLYGCFFSFYYALAPMLGAANVLVLGPAASPADPARDYAGPVNLLLVSWILLCLGYSTRRGRSVRRRTRVGAALSRLPRHFVLRSALGMLAAGVGVEILRARGLLTPVVAGIANLFSLLMEAALVLLVCAWRRGELSPRLKASTVLGGFAAVVVALGSGITGSLMFLLFAIAMGYWISRRPVSVWLLIVGALMLASCIAVRGVIKDYRDEIWHRRGGAVSEPNRAGYLVALLESKLHDEGPAGAVGDGWDAVIQRSANVDLLIDVMHRTPSEVPYWRGYTYESLVGALVPRFLWPDKPEKTLGQQFGHRYRYLAEADHVTSVNLPVLVEFYLNYSTAGVLIGMFVLGMLLRSVDDAINRPGQPLLISIAATPLLARLLAMECDLSLVFGGLPMHLLAEWAIGLAMLWWTGVALRMARPRPPWYAPQLARRRADAGPAPLAAARSRT